MIHMNTSTLHMGLTLGHLLVTVTSVVLSVVFVIYALGVGCNTSDCNPLVFITSTFFSSNKVGSLAGWAVATQRAQLGEVVQYPTDKDAFAFSHYFECMASAQMANVACPTTDPLAGYTFCLRNTTSTNAALTACDALSTSFSQPWPTSEEYLQCLFRFDAMRNSVSIRGSQNVFRLCVAKSMWPFFEVQQTMDTPLFLGSFNWIILIAVGFLSMTSFAVYTASPVEQGLVKKGEPQYLMRLGTLWTFLSVVWLFTFLILFLVVAVRHHTVFEDNGGLPTTGSTTVITLVVLSSCFVYFLSEIVEARDFEFRVHAYHFLKHHGGNAADHMRHAYDAASKHGKVIFSKFKQESALGTSMLNPGLEEYSIDAKGVAEYYTPPLIAVWADAYFPDACIFLGAAGATGQLTTDQAWNLFSLFMFYRLLNMMIARFMYQCFMNNLSFRDTDEFKYNDENHKIVTYPSEMFRSMTAKDNKKGSPDDTRPLLAPKVTKYDPKAVSPHINIQVMALSTQISAIYILSALCFMVFNENSPLSDFSLFRWFFLLGFLIPEGLRISIHLICQVRDPEPDSVPWNLLNAYMFVWIWDLCVRIIFISIIFFSTAGYPGTLHFLADKSGDLLETYTAILAQPIL